MKDEKSLENKLSDVENGILKTIGDGMFTGSSIAIAFSSFSDSLYSFVEGNNDFGYFSMYLGIITSIISVMLGCKTYIDTKKTIKDLELIRSYS